MINQKEFIDTLEEKFQKYLKLLATDDDAEYYMPSKGFSDEAISTFIQWLNEGEPEVKDQMWNERKTVEKWNPADQDEF